MARQKEKKETHKVRNTTLAIGSMYAARPTYNVARQTIYQSEWRRPNGEIVPLRGFSPRELRDVRPSLENIDKFLDPRHKVNVKTIDRKVIGRPRIRTGLEFGKQIFDLVKEDPKDLKYVDVKGMAELIAKTPPIYGAHYNPLTGGTVSIGAHSFKEGASTVQHLVTHEIGHGVDNKRQFSGAGFANAAGWRRKHERGKVGFIKDITGADTHRRQGRNTSTPFAYQGTRVHEDFAETFAGVVNKNTDQIVHRGIHIDASRRKYMQRQFAHKSPMQLRVDGKTVPTARIGTVRTNNLNRKHFALAAGGALAVGGGYYAYRHRDEIKRKFNSSKDHYFARRGNKRVRVKNSRQRRRR